MNIAEVLEQALCQENDLDENEWVPSTLPVPSTCTQGHALGCVSFSHFSYLIYLNIDSLSSFYCQYVC